MLHFSTATLAKKRWVDKIVMDEDSPSADYNFGNIYIWDKHYSQLICRYEDRMLTMLRRGGEVSFVFPIGSGDLRGAIEALRQYAGRRGIPFSLRGVTEKHIEMLEREYPGCFEYTEDTDCADYIYSIEKLSTYAGKSLHAKRNFCNRFEAEHKWSFVPLTRELIPQCLDMLDVWTEENVERLDKSIHFEHDAIIRAFAAYEELALEGGVLFADGALVGFTVGEPCCRNTYDVHFEKALGEMPGAYPMVCREFARLLKEKRPGIEYLNREDDMGLEPLRQSKLSYKPEYILRKYTARWKDGQESGHE